MEAVDCVSAGQLPDADLDDDGPDVAPPVHRIVPAAGCARPSTRGLVSVFDLARQDGTRGLRLAMQSASGASGQDRRFTQAQRDAGTTRVTGGQYPADRWTAEREAHELARRARQRPPRPTAKAKTRGRKVRAWDGEE